MCVDKPRTTIPAEFNIDRFGGRGFVGQTKYERQNRAKNFSTREIRTN